MPTFANEPDAHLQDALDRWRLEASEAFYDIEGWRDDAAERAYYQGDRSREWPDPPENFYSHTVWLVGQITSSYPKLDTTPLQDAWEAIDSWHKDHRADRVPDQAILQTTFDRAMMVIQAVEQDIYSRRTRDEVAQPEAKDLTAYVEAVKLWPSQFETYRKFCKFMYEPPEIRRERKPRRFYVHAADWANFWAHHAVQMESDDLPAGYVDELRERNERQEALRQRKSLKGEPN